MDDKARSRRRDAALRRQNAVSFVVGVLGVLLFIVTSAKVVLVLTMVVLFFLPPISRLRSMRRKRPKK
jgi:hypothetical protein